MLRTGLGVTSRSFLMGRLRHYPLIVQPRAGLANRNMAGRNRYVESDSFLKVAQRYHPAVMRSFKLLFQEERDNKGLCTAVEASRALLSYLDTRPTKYFAKHIYRNQMLPPVIQVKRNGAVESCVQLLGEQDPVSVQTLTRVATLMAVNIPSSEPLCYALYKATRNQLKCGGITSIADLDAYLLCCYTLQICNEVHRWKAPFAERAMNATTNALIRYLEKSQTNHLLIDGQVSKDSTNSNNCDLTAAGCVHSSRNLERISLIFHLANGTNMEKLSSKQRKVFVESIAQYAQKVLKSVSRTPICLITLKEIWTTIPAALSDYFRFYKLLYDSVLLSITTNPLQIANQEETVASLLSLMVKSQYKSKRVIHKIFELTSHQGMNCNAVGIDMFNCLVMLDDFEFASTVLENFLNKSFSSLHTLISNARKGQGKGLSLTTKARQHIINMLQRNYSATNSGGNVKNEDAATSPPSCESSSDTNTSLTAVTDEVSRRNLSRDLLLALFSFETLERDTVGKHVLQNIELEIVLRAQSLPFHEAENILCGYAAAGRLYPPVVNVIDGVILTNLQKNVVFKRQRLLSMIWSCAKLNYPSAPYLDLAISKIIESVPSIKVLSPSGIGEMVALLWSLAVLRKLDPAQFLSFLPLLSSNKAKRIVHSGYDSHLMMLNQIRSELRCVHRERCLELESSAVSNSVKYTTEHRSQSQNPTQEVLTDSDKEHMYLEMNKTMDECENYFTAVLPPDEELRKKLARWPHNASSAAHHSISNILLLLGIEHVNEYVLSNGAVVDIFIPPVVRKTKKKIAQTAMNEGGVFTKPEDDFRYPGVVIEYDGPTHFESYMQRPTGTTALKHRHIKSLGYDFMSISYQYFNAACPRSEQLTMLREVFAHHLLQFEDNEEPSDDRNETAVEFERKAHRDFLSRVFRVNAHDEGASDWLQTVLTQGTN